ncbi:PEP-CTERM sorting domain-containing protein [Desulfobacula sp.]|uniref:PEP-CTERM sorting domain-containing protein n=1 Tax=Desulfobacula sp. TaxID=2593537 RepID=UPI0025BA6C61|nr:PEP-CTERM sorting domain-containing protein [Desulfobacula sp.]
MKKMIKAGLLFGLMLLFAGNVWALPMAGDTVQMNTEWGDNYGMKINNSTNTNTIGDLYNTFCIEKNEIFNNNGIYKVESVGSVATLGGTNYGVWETESTTGKTGDPLSQESIWLYASFFNGDFDSLFTGLTHQQGVDKVQNAIWYMEDEITSNTDWSLLSNGISDFKVTGWDIKVVNLVATDGTGNFQSQLVGAPVPEPATIVLFGIGLLGLAGIGRKRIQK